jgi:hypothetical protein
MLHRCFLLLAIAGFWPGSALARADSEYNWNFQSSRFDNLCLAPHGKAAIRLLHPRDDGLHIEIPARADITFVGFTPRFKLSGDFEVTLEWSIKRWSRPSTGYGTGPSLYLTTEGEFQPAASISRVLRADGKSVYSVFIARGVMGERKSFVKMFNSDALNGKLRISRAERTLQFAVVDGKSADFRLLHEQEFVKGDVNLLRAGLQQSDSIAASEAVIRSFSVHAGDLPLLPSEQKSATQPLYTPRYNPPPTPVSYAWLWQLLVASALALAVLFWLVRRRSLTLLNLRDTCFPAWMIWR